MTLNNHFSTPSIRTALAGLTLTLLSAGILLTGTQSAQAQTGSSRDLQAPVGASDRGSQTNGDFGTIDNMFGLFHRVQQGAIADPYAFGRSQQQNLNTAAATFRQRQLELLQQQGQPGVAPSATPQITAPSQTAAPAAAPAPSQTAAPNQISNP
jgi:hypothetical protein